jgi:hypothetical protein
VGAAVALVVVAQAAEQVPVLPARQVVALVSVEALEQVRGQAPLLSHQAQVRCQMRA